MTRPPYDIEITHVFDAPRERVYAAFTDPDQFVQWYGPVGFPVRRDTVELDARVGGTQRFTMVADMDPSMRTTFTGEFTDVMPDELLASSGSWEGIPGMAEPWPSHLRVELHDESGGTRVTVLEGPHPEGSADLGRQAWQMMVGAIEAQLATA